MTNSDKTSISIPATLFDQVEVVAKNLNVAPGDLFEMAVKKLLREYQAVGSERTVNQGEIYWLIQEPSIPHPYVVIQDNLFNHSRISTVIVCALTSNLNRAGYPGNVLLDPGEANLSRQSVVEVSKISSVDKSQLGEFIGSLSERRIHQILAGMRLLQDSFFAR